MLHASDVNVEKRGTSVKGSTGYRLRCTNAGRREIMRFLRSGAFYSRPRLERAIARLPSPEMARHPSLAASEIGTHDPFYSSYHMPSQVDGVMRSDEDQVLYCSGEPDYPCVIYKTSAMECLKVGSVASQVK